MANYSIPNSTGLTYGTSCQAMTTTYKSIITIGNGSTAAVSGFAGATVASPYLPRRGKIYDILIGQNYSPADTYVTWDMMRMTALGSSGNVFAGALTSASSLFALDSADAAANSFITMNASIETNSSAAADVWSIAINQRASYRWVAAPGSEFVYPATSSAGLALRCLGAGSFAGTVTGTVMFQE